MLTLEHGWLNLIDGLTVQRYFLHAYPFILQSLNKEINPREYTLDRNPVYETINAYANRFKNDEEEIRGSFQFKGKVWSICGKQSDFHIKTFQSALEIISASGLFFIPELASGVVYFNGFQPEPIHFGIRFSSDLNEKSGAIQILSEAARHFAKVCWDSYELDFNEIAYRSLWSTDLISIQDLVISIFTSSILLDLYNRIQMEPDSIYNQESKRLQEVEHLIPDILSVIDHMNMDDLIQLYLPSNKRFDKYRTGKGAGQT
ncbi:hypothetical protein IC620_13715 [Hazenella sp. IB182357]|uniref:Uncharacterized protein n=1 Tax=Polycladospora coralii TaxID=2771432 RepID=A0A926NBW6_9BACL|nr:hypothetical protein [Polycladospora coralii]MBD1373407.1 hypothetical protein [Polycladospora coralii]